MSFMYIMYMKRCYTKSRRITTIFAFLRKKSINSHCSFWDLPRDCYSRVIALAFADAVGQLILKVAYFIFCLILIETLIFQEIKPLLRKAPFQGNLRKSNLEESTDMSIVLLLSSISTVRLLGNILNKNVKRQETS